MLPDTLAVEFGGPRSHSSSFPEPARLLCLRGLLGDDEGKTRPGNQAHVAASGRERPFRQSGAALDHQSGAA
jgi:hypothetical protein